MDSTNSLKTIGFLNVVGAPRTYTTKSGHERLYVTGAIAVKGRAKMLGFIANGSTAEAILALPRRAHVAFGGNFGPEKTIKVKGKRAKQTVRDFSLRWVRPTNYVRKAEPIALALPLE
jgi:hypothetical protein